MVRAFRIAAASVLGIAIGTMATARAGERHWTVTDIVTAPRVSSLSLSPDGRSALYIRFQEDIASDRGRVELRQVDLTTRRDRLLLKANSINNVQVIPGTPDRSALVDLGHGVQLYRIAPTGDTTPIVEADPVRYGPTEGTIGFDAVSAPRLVGILAYSWSPDGSALWYVRPRLVAGLQQPLSGETAGFHQYAGYRRQAPAVIEYHLREGDRDRIVAERPVTDLFALQFGGMVSWRDGDPYWIEERSDTIGSSERSGFRWNRVSSRKEAANTEPDGNAIGPYGGTLSTEGYGAGRRLVEKRGAQILHDYGAVPFVLKVSGSTGQWRAVGGRTVVAMKDLDRPSYGLVVLDRRHGMQRVPVSTSLTDCDFTANLSAGICVQQGIAQAPRLVRVDSATLSVSPVLDLDPDHAAITPLRVEPRRWTNRDGFVATGFVIYPRGYRQGQRYPAVVVTHGPDADERFVALGFQWHFPVQVLAERGYFVVGINDPVPSQSAELSAAYDAWGDGGMPVERVQDLVWLEGVRSFEDAVAGLVAEGLVDADRVGIAGYSRGSQMVNVTMTQSVAFKVASSGDGGYLEPAGYRAGAANYRTVFGGSPYDPDALTWYRRLSPTFRARQANGPILQQVASNRPDVVEFDDALRVAGVPSRLTLYQGADAATNETHLFHRPSNQLFALGENLAWFDFWLRGQRDPDYPRQEDFVEWEKMKARWKGRADVAPPPSRE